MKLFGSICILLSSCLINKQETLLITRTLGSQSCTDYFLVSNKLESNLELSKTLQKYLYKSLVDVSSCNIDSTLITRLYKRNSFKKSILLFYTDSRYESLSHFEYPSRWREGYDNLLRNCKDTIVKYSIIDSLLSINISNGLVALWNKPELQRLHYLDSYLKKSIQEKSKYKCSELAVIFHNSGNFDRRNELINFLENESSSKGIAESLKKLFKDFVIVDYEQYVMEILGGH